MATHLISEYFAITPCFIKISRDPDIKAKFEADVGEWLAGVKSWIQSVNAQVEFWNIQVKENFDGNEATYFFVPLIDHSNVLSFLAFARIVVSNSVSCAGRTALRNSIILYLHATHESTKAHIDQFYSICTHLLNKSLIKPDMGVGGGVEVHTKAFDGLLSLEHAVSQFQDPKAALLFLESFSPEEIGPDVQLVGVLNTLIWEQVHKIETNDEESPRTHESVNYGQ